MTLEQEQRDKMLDHKLYSKTLYSFTDVDM